jgi:hypothetical protein
MPVSLGPHPRYLEELRIGGGYNSTPDGGADFDKAGNIAANGTLDVEGAATFGGDISIAGDLEVAGVDTTWSIYLPASLGMPDPSLPCAAFAITNWRTFQVATGSLAFDATNPEAAYFQFRLPDSYDGRPLKFTIEWSASAGTSGDVRWGVNTMRYGNGESLIQTGTLSYVLDTLIAIEYLHVAELSDTPSNSTIGLLVTARILRDASHASDTFNADAKLIGLRVSY